MEEHYRNEPARAARVRLLLEHPEMELTAIAGTIGYSQQTVKRWLKTYRESGIGGLLKMRSTDAGERKHDDLESLRAGIASGSIATKEDVKAWLKEQGVTAQSLLPGTAPSGVWSNKGVMPAEAEHEPTVSRGSGTGVDLPKMVAFLNSLPATHEPGDWIKAFRHALTELFADVSRMSLTVNMYCDLVQPQHYQPSLAFTQHLISGKKEFHDISSEYSSHEHVERFLAMLRNTDFAFVDYHEPHGFVYYFDGSAFLGMLLLWQEIGKAPISQETLSMMNPLHPFIVFLFSDLIARHNNARPVEHAFDTSLHTLINEAQLTPQERRIVILQLLGLSYDEMADTLYISPNTLRYHLRSIYSKTGTHSQAELFARYFASVNFVHKSHR